MGRDGNAYYRVDISILVVDGFYGQAFSNDVATGVDDGHIFCMGHYMIKITDAYLVEQNAEDKYGRRQYVVKHQRGSRSERVCYQDSQTDNGKVQNTQNQNNPCRYDSRFRSLGKQSAVALGTLAQVVVNEPSPV